MEIPRNIGQITQPIMSCTNYASPRLGFAHDGCWWLAFESSSCSSGRILVSEDPPSPLSLHDFQFIRTAPPPPVYSASPFNFVPLRPIGSYRKSGTFNNQSSHKNWSGSSSQRFYKVLTLPRGSGLYSGPIWPYATVLFSKHPDAANLMFFGIHIKLLSVSLGLWSSHCLTGKVGFILSINCHCFLGAPTVCSDEKIGFLWSPLIYLHISTGKLLKDWVVGGFYDICVANAFKRMGGQCSWKKWWPHSAN